MDKNWLIRTKSNHILGPISKEKVLELYNNGSIKPDDEVVSGNGFWFFVREEDMVKKYLIGNAVQGFNPISEAKDVLTGHAQGPSVEQDDITLVGGINLAGLNDEVPAQPPATPQIKSQPIPEVKEAPVVEIKKKNNSEVNSKVLNPISQSHKKPLKKQSYLKYIGIVGFLVLFLLIYFRKMIIQSLFQGEITFSSPITLIDSAHAQEEIPAKKKSS